MKIAHISLADWNEAVTGMTLEEEGFYWRMTRLLYSTPAGTISDDDPEVAKLMNVGVRVYRRLKAKMLGWHKETVAVVARVVGGSGSAVSSTQITSVGEASVPELVSVIALACVSAWASET